MLTGLPDQESRKTKQPIVNSGDKDSIKGGVIQLSTPSHLVNSYFNINEKNVSAHVIACLCAFL